MSNPEKSVLVVDDHLSVTQVVSRCLVRENYECICADSGEEALTKLQEQEFGLMLADIRMPGIDGVELLKRCRESYPDMAVIMLTGVTDTNVAIESMRLGASDYILKPFDFDELVLSAQRALEYRQLRIQNRQHHEELEQKVQERTRLLKRQHRYLRRLHEQLEGSFYDTIRVFIGLIELYEPFLGTHVKRVAALSKTLAQHFSLAKEDVQTVEMCALLHDIGMLGIPPELMLKTRAELSIAEFDSIKQAPIYGQRALQSIPRLEYVGEIIRAQHERYDGTGFPDQLRAKDIPYEARLLAVANAYDAMRFKRDSSQSLSHTVAIGHLRRMSGRQFDPQVVDAFCNVFETPGRPQSNGVSQTKEADGQTRDHGLSQYRELAEVSTVPMRVVELKPGMKIAKPIRTEAGAVLVAAGTVLNELTIRKLTLALAVQEPVFIIQDGH